MLGAPALAAESPDQPQSSKTCTGDNGGITLPPGFCATVLADHIGHARQMAVTPMASST